MDPCRPPDFRHLRNLTDEVGILQHTRGEIPAPDLGYALDDAGRALVVATETARRFPAHAPADVAAVTASSLRLVAHCLPTGETFHTFVGPERSFRDTVGSADSHGRTVWGLSVAAARSADPATRDRASALLRNALGMLTQYTHLRPKAYALLGLTATGGPDVGDPFAVAPHVATFTRDLTDAFAAQATNDWPWFEDTLTYANALLPAALLVAARSPYLASAAGLPEKARAVGLKSLDFLRRTLVANGVPAPVGNAGWYPRGGTRALYDQQCIDSGDMVLACGAAFRVTGDEAYRTEARRWWRWFFGENTRGVSLYRPSDGAVYDGLTPDGVNGNRGAESILAFLLAHLALAAIVCREEKAPR